MSNKKTRPPYCIIALCGKSGSGKDTLKNFILKSDVINAFHNIITYTTRPPRDYEKNGTDYFFISEELFKEKICSGSMLEYTSFNGWLYGCDSASLKKDKINIGVFNPTGIKTLSENEDVCLIPVLVETPDKIRLSRLVQREENPDVNEIIRRWGADAKDFEDFEKEIPDLKRISGTTPLV